MGNIGRLITRAEKDLKKIQQQPISSESCNARISLEKNLMISMPNMKPTGFAISSFKD